ncbi:DNA repair protein RecO [Herbaspirillum hiltneri]|uniref:DNA repair protein RecO n=1 Tax=Herbaspirillum hiltneri TaxID=341045 RepID=UPI000AF10449|nr:DNA repair protein RecO [Herbaspirillum hiltneri]
MAAIIADSAVGQPQTPDAEALSAAAAESVLANAKNSAAPRRSPRAASATGTTRRPKIPEKDTRVQAQPGFVLHSYPYKETSLIVDVFSRDHGRMALVAKGAKRPLSKLRGVLQTFQPLSVSWSGKSEVRTLTAAEWVGGLLPLEKSALLCGFYLNELLVKLLAREDAHPALFDHYVSTLNQLAHGESTPIVLRKFERALLKETGVAGDWTVCVTNGKPVAPDDTYVVDPEQGVRFPRLSDAWPKVSGKTLLDMEKEDYSDAATQSQSKLLMRSLLSHHLGGTQLNTRQILIDLSQL